MRIWLWGGAVFLAVTTLGSTRIVASDRVWLEIRSPHFRVVTDAGEKRATEVANYCEQMRAAFSVLMAKATADDPAPLLIFALKNQQEVDDLVQNRGRKLRHAGVFLPSTDQSFILLDVSGDPWRTVFHEYAHELLHANTSAAVQTWFEEGFAEYFSTLDTRSGNTKIGEVPIGELQFLRQNGKLMRLADLVRVDQKSEIYNENGPLQAAFYAQSWLLVHYLFDRELINRSQSFFSAMGSGIGLDQAVLKAFGMKTEVLEQELLSYARGDKFRFFSFPAPRAHSLPAPKVEQMSEVTASALKLDVRWHTRSEQEKGSGASFANEYRALLVLEPANASVLRGMGVTLLDAGDYLHSLLYLRKAVRADPDDALNHYALAELLSAMDSGAAEDAHQGYSMEREAEACTTLNPTFADGYRLRASAAGRRGDFDDGVSLMRRAVALSPRTESYALNLANIELQQRDFGPALALLHQLQNSRNPDVVKKAEYFLSAQKASLNEN
jgi:tetratricopeptide (TPR) repeat protein